MQIIKGIENYIIQDKPVYLALGNFDGVHLGHKKLITDLVDKAHRNQGIAVGFIFEPHPTKVLAPDKAPKLLVTAQRKAELLEALGLDILIYEAFTRELACWSPEEFVKKILQEKLKVREVFVGFNYSFGHKGTGTPEMLIELGDKYNFRVNIIPPVTVEGEIASSSLIRKYLEIGDISSARLMLGHWPMIEGEVIEGEHRGAQIGFPTANLGVDPDLSIPGQGVYAVRTVIGGKSYLSSVNIGIKPTFHSVYPISVEAHIIDFSGDIYGKHIRLFFIQKIRGEQKFAGINELVVQIKKDCEETRRLGESLISNS